MMRDRALSARQEQHGEGSHTHIAQERNWSSAIRAR
jgi:hypothetical protein